MTIASEVNKSGPYSGNGATTVFAGGFSIADEAHVQVILADADDVETVQVLDTDYTVSGVGDDTFDVTMLVAPASGETLTLIRNVPFTQEIDLQNQGAYYAETVEAALDLGVARDQQLQEQVDRAVKAPVSSEIDPDALIADLQEASADAVAAASAASASQSAASSSASSASGSASAASASAAAAAASAAAAADVIIGNYATAIHAATGKTTPVDADEFALVDSEASNGPKKLTWASLKAGIVQTGAFTPAFAATGCTFSYNIQNGFYVKVGSLVFFTIEILLNTSGNTLTGNPLSITGLPFTAFASGAGANLDAYWINSTSSLIRLWGGVQVGSASIVLAALTAAATSAAGTAAANAILHATNGSYLSVSGCYRAAS